MKKKKQKTPFFQATTTTARPRSKYGMEMDRSKYALVGRNGESFFENGRGRQKRLFLFFLSVAGSTRPQKEIENSTLVLPLNKEAACVFLKGRKISLMSLFFSPHRASLPFTNVGNESEKPLNHRFNDRLHFIYIFPSSFVLTLTLEAKKMTEDTRVIFSLGKEI